MKLLIHIIMLGIALAGLNAHAGKKIIKWVDKNGVTQYGDRPPTSSNVKSSSVLNKQGVTIQKIETKKVTTAEGAVSAEQSRYDNALLASYNSIEEIEIARKRNVKIDELTLVNLETKHEKTSLDLQKNNKDLLVFAKNKQPAPANITNAIEANMADLAKLRKQMAIRVQAIEKINARYTKDKKRYAELKAKKSNVGNIKYSNKYIAELKAWRDDTQKRLNGLKAESLKFKRRGENLPRYIQEGLIDTTKELKNAKDEVAAAELAKKRNDTQISN